VGITRANQTAKTITIPEIKLKKTKTTMIWGKWFFTTFGTNKIIRKS
jgi:hypothetical protein